MRANHQLRGKKALLNEFGTLSIAVAGLAISLIVTLLILDQGREISVQNTAMTNISNRSISVTNGTKTVLTTSCVTLGSCGSIRNSSQRYMGKGNVTCAIEGENGLTIYPYFTDAGYASGEATTLYVDFTCAFADASYNSTLTLTNATSDIPGWIPVIVVTVLGGILLSIVAIYRRQQ